MSTMVAFILAGGVGKRLSLLTRYRAKPAVPFGGRYRIIDFTLTNCVTSGVTEVYVLTQYISRSLGRHIGIGKPWDLDRTAGGLHVLHPHLGYQAADWYRGTADAIVQNMSILRALECSHVLILSGDHVYRMDYRDFFAFHLESGKPASLGVVPVPKSLTREFGIATVDRGGSVLSFDEKPKRAGSNLASMGIYIFEKQFLMQTLRELAPLHDDLDFGKHVMPHLVRRGALSAYRYRGYWLDIGTVKSYYLASLDLLGARPRLRLHSHVNPVITSPDDSPPAVVSPRASVTSSLVSNGCVIGGSVKESILSPGVTIEEGASVERSVIFHECVIRRGAEVRGGILDKGVVVGEGARVGPGDASVPNRLQPGYLDFGVTIVGKRTIIPPRMRIGANCLVAGSLDNGIVPGEAIEDGGVFIEGVSRL